MAGEATAEQRTGSADAALMEKAAAKGWPAQLISIALADGVPAEALHAALDAGLTPRQAMEQMSAGVQVSMAWAAVPTERGVRARPGKRGLTIDDINVGSYADVPDLWPDQTMRPRGSFVQPGAVSMGYTIYAKAEVWAPNLGALYEEAIQRRWRPATDIDWAGIGPLPEDVERAICQVCTELAEYNYAKILALGKWVREVAYGYHEVKLFLSTVLFDAGRHFEAFRKRALANGGGMGVQSPGYRLLPIRDALNYSEMAALLFLLNDSFVHSLYRMGAGLARNEAESRLFALAAQDQSRHLAYGIEHMRFLLEHQPERRGEMEKYMQKGEEYLVKDFDADAPLREALAILLGGSLREIGEGFRQLRTYQRRHVQDYVARAESAGLHGQRERLHPALAALLDPAPAAR